MNRTNRLRVTAATVAVAALVAATAAQASTTGNGGGQPADPSAHGRSHRPVCAAVGKDRVRCHAQAVTDAAGKPLVFAAPNLTGGAGDGYGPVEFHTAYRLPKSAPNRQTIAVVGAYDNPNTLDDLNTYSKWFGIPTMPRCSSTVTTACFQKYNQYGTAGSYPAVNGGWAQEMSMDVQIAHAICQNCRIDLVEATTNAWANMAKAERTAGALGATVISNSWGGDESAAVMSTYGASFRQLGVAVVASTGDEGYGVQFPADTNSVVAVGGTQLFLNADKTRYAEHVWSGAGSGCSQVETALSTQLRAANYGLTGCNGLRAEADVSADADPNTPAWVYDSTSFYDSNGNYVTAGWRRLGGTSLAAPIIAGAFGLAGNADTVNYAASIIYNHPGSLLDIARGSNGSCGTIMCNATTGYDGPTGMGTPNGLGAF